MKRERTENEKTPSRYGKGGMLSGVARVRLTCTAVTDAGGIVSDWIHELAERARSGNPNAHRRGRLGNESGNRAGLVGPPIKDCRESMRENSASAESRLAIVFHLFFLRKLAHFPSSSGR